MKGTNFNGSFFADKGTSRSEGTSMFSVNGLVAFSYEHYCSPDGRSFSSGCIPTTGEYKLQEEIVLEEFDKTTSDRYGSGRYNVAKIVDLKDHFWHIYQKPVVEKIFLLQILEHGENIFGFIHGDIAEVKNHPGKFLHIYEIPQGYCGCKGETFASTVAAIIAKKENEDTERALVVEKKFRGVELTFGITASGWYASSASFGEYKPQLQHEYDSTSRSHYKMVISDKVPPGAFSFYLPRPVGEIPMSLWIPQDGSEPSIDTLTDTSWCNSQNWHYSQIKNLSIQKGWIVVDGVDVYDCTKAIIDKNTAAEKAVRKEKFEKLSNEVISLHGEDIFKKVLTAKKGQVLAFLKVLLEIKEPIEKDLFDTAFAVTRDAITFKNISAFLKAGIDPNKAKKIAVKAHAWNYLGKVLPDGPIIFAGNFFQAKEALEIYADAFGIDGEYEEKFVLDFSK